MANAPRQQTALHRYLRMGLAVEPKDKRAKVAPLATAVASTITVEAPPLTVALDVTLPLALAMVYNLRREFLHQLCEA